MTFLAAEILVGRLLRGPARIAVVALFARGGSAAPGLPGLCARHRAAGEQRYNRDTCGAA
ncbi:hypothetical protein MAHJHV35_47580 [Mycobacterium avium subsp. hominissuis]